jgi:ubiquinone/menaquinone biosynthesis C-methylase UbiE
VSPARSFQEKSYQEHYANFQQYSSGGNKESHARTWFEKDTVDAWRHGRMYQALDPILRADPKAKWLTVGDGRYGNDAKYILEKGCDALASDISDILLKEAKDIGYINDYSRENAESLSFSDSEFDYVFCKESYHHFPRPMVALYEMLRVASKGVLLIEPNDAYINDKLSEILFRNLKDIIKLLLRRKVNRHNFEEVGNYVFSISRREVEKVALGLNYKIVALKGISDAYFQGVEYEKLAHKGPLQRKVRLRIGIANLFCRLGIKDYGLLAAIIFKQDPSQELLQELSKEGYEIIHLPENPHLV